MPLYPPHQSDSMQTLLFKLVHNITDPDAFRETIVGIFEAMTTEQKDAVASALGVTSIMDIKGTWNATTNSPTLSSGLGSAGDVYVVATAGSTNIDGNSSWKVGDMAVFSGTAWLRVEGQSIVAATTSAAGIVQLATSAEASTGTDTAKAVTPAGVKKAIEDNTAANVPDASETVKGKVELATTQEASTGTDTVRAVTPAGVKASILANAPAPAPATTTTAGVVRLAAEESISPGNTDAITAGFLIDCGIELHTPAVGGSYLGNVGGINVNEGGTGITFSGGGMGSNYSLYRANSYTDKLSTDGSFAVAGNIIVSGIFTVPGSAVQFGDFLGADMAKLYISAGGYGTGCRYVPGLPVSPMSEGFLFTEYHETAWFGYDGGLSLGFADSNSTVGYYFAIDGAGVRLTASASHAQFLYSSDEIATLFSDGIGGVSGIRVAISGVKLEGKLGFFNNTPVTRPAAIANATDATSAITQLNAALAALRTLGLIAP